MKQDHVISYVTQNDFQRRTCFASGYILFCYFLSCLVFKHGAKNVESCIGFICTLDVPNMNVKSRIVVVKCRNSRRYRALFTNFVAKLCISVSRRNLLETFVLIILFILVVTLTPNVHRLGLILVVSVIDLVHWSVGQ